MSRQFFFFICILFSTLSTSPTWAVNPNSFEAVVDTTADEGDDADVIIGSDNFPIISFYDRTSGALRVAKCGNRGCGMVSSVTTVDGVDDTGGLTSIAMGASGFPVISYYDFTNARLEIAMCSDLGCTSGTTLVSPAILSSDVAALSKLIISDGNPFIFHYDFVQNDLLGLRCSNSICSAFPALGASLLDSDFAVGRGMSASLGADGLPIISYQSGIHEVRLAHCTSANCSSGVTVSSIENPVVNDVGRFTALAIGNDGFPIIAYSDDTDGILKVAKCQDASCIAAPRITSVYDSDGSVDEIDMALSADGNPVISFYERNAGPSRLLVAGCNTPDCNNNSIITEIDEGGSRGGSSAGTTSIVMGSDNRPVIAYYKGVSSTDASLMLARCSQANCDDDKMFKNSFE